MSKFAQRLKELRVARGRHQKDMADYLSIRTRSYQAYEGGEREPSIDRLIAIADYLDVTLDYLVGRTDAP